MCEYKRPIAILCCCASLLPVKQAHAFWPVLDFGEIIPIVSNVTTTLDSLSQAKEQLKQLEDAIRAIGESIDTINQFSQDLRKNIQDMTGIINDIQDTVNVIPGVDADFGNITDTLNQANEMQSGFAGSLTSQTNDILGQTSGLSDKVTSSIDSAQSAAHDAQDFLNDAQDKANNPDIKDTVAETEDTESKKNFWDKVKDKSEQVSDLTEDANKALDQVDKTGLIDTGDIRDTINSVNNKQENIVDMADTSKSGYEDLKGEVDKAKEDKIGGELKEKNTGEEDGEDKPGF